MKPRVTIWGNDEQFVAHRGDERMLFDRHCFADEASMLAAARRWVDGEAVHFEIERHYILVRVGVFARYERVWRGVEIVGG